MTKTRVGIILGGSLAFLACAVILGYAIPDRDILAITLAMLYLIGTLGSAYGMWRYQRWALALSRLLAGAAFAFGCYIAHFAWTFWLFQTPTLKDRILAVLRPQVSLFLICPILWLIFSALPKVREKFRS